MWQCLESWLLWFYQLVKDLPWLSDMIFSPRLRWALTALLAASKTARTESLADIDHVILFMQGIIPQSVSHATYLMCHRESCL